MLLQKGVGAYDKAGSAEPALSGSLFGKGFLDGMERTILRQALDGQQFSAIGLRRQRTAGIDGAAIEYDAAAAAITRATDQLCAFKMARVQGFEERFTGQHAPLYRPSIQSQRDVNVRHWAMPFLSYAPVVSLASVSCAPVVSLVSVRPGRASGDVFLPSRWEILAVSVPHETGLTARDGRTVREP